MSGRSPMRNRPARRVAGAGAWIVAAWVLLPARPLLAAPPEPARAPTAAAAPVQGGAEDIRDIRGPVHLPYPWLPLLYGAGAVAAGGLAYGLYHLLRRRPGRRRSPGELALRRLAEARRLMTPAETRAFSVAVSEAVREYVEDQFQVRAAHRTTEEFLHDLLAGAGPPLSGYRPLLADFLASCDLAKFAGTRLGPAELQALHERACAFVTESAAAPTQPRGTP